jgi:hypothetical protein
MHLNFIAHTCGKLLIKAVSSGKILRSSGVLGAQLAIAAKVSIRRNKAAFKKTMKN